MTLDAVAKIAGILGLIISVATFVLTRWERRASIIFGLDSGSSSDFDSELEEPMETVNLTITNSGAVSVHLDLRTLVIEANGHKLNAWRENHWGPEQREVLLRANEFRTIGIPLVTFIGQLKITSPKTYDDNSFNFMLPLRISVSATNGRTFTSKKIRYWEATGEFHRA